MKRIHRRLLAIFPLFIFVSCLPSTLKAQKESSGGAIVLTNLTVVDVRSGELRPKQTLVIKGDRIISAGPSKSLADPPGARSIDCSGLYAIPGLWDMHVHLVLGDWFPGGKNISLPLFVANGVTSVRDMGSELEVIQKWRGEIVGGLHQAAVADSTRRGVCDRG